MTFETLEALTANAVTHVFGKNDPTFQNHVITCDPNDGFDFFDFDLGTTVEVTFAPSVSPLPYFSSPVSFYVSAMEDGTGDVQAFFGTVCDDPDDAIDDGTLFFSREPSDGWYVESELEEECGLHLMRIFSYDPDEEQSLSEAIEQLFAELLESDTVSELTPFIHHFED